MTHLTKSSKKLELSFEAIGTTWRIDISADEPQAEALKRLIIQRIDQFDVVYSRFRDDSLVTAISQASGSYAFADDAPELFSWYRRMYDVTDGSVTPLIGQTLADAGYDADYRLSPAAEPLTPPPAWDEVMHFSSGVLHTMQPILLDFGAAGKGYLVDLICRLLTEHGVREYCVDAGGDLRIQSDQPEPPTRVGLEDPRDPARAIGVASIRNQSLCGSAGNRRSWGGFHHILDPVSLTSPRHIAATWAVAASAMVADGMTTCLYFTKPEILHEQFEFAHLIIFADGSVDVSKDFPAELFLTGSED